MLIINYHYDQRYAIFLKKLDHAKVLSQDIITILLPTSVLNSFMEDVMLVFK